MDNLAHHLQPKRKEEVEKKVNRSPIEKPKKFRITLGEKILVIACSIVLATLAITIVSKSAVIYLENRELQTLEQQVENQLKINRDLNFQVTELSSPERIRKIAEEELGMKLDSKKVKFVGQ
ncbi:cell division protein FtsL [Lottiidibacillus patelloidae]|uniref:cell division protein FtsL n=1 Tax=Lottiidibacillus patelloidae TaxID=2670334 RepID=UPI001303DE3A|nr:cell division protein FtsL [Lottiidibacillus patelloidae]